MDQEKELIIALKQGDEKAFNILYKQYWKQVYNFCRLYLTNTEEAEEVVQDVFVRLWQSRDFLRENDNFKGLYSSFHAIWFLTKPAKALTMISIRFRFWRL